MPPNAKLFRGQGGLSRGAAEAGLSRGVFWPDMVSSNLASAASPPLERTGGGRLHVLAGHECSARPIQGQSVHLTNHQND